MNHIPLYKLEKAAGMFGGLVGAAKSFGSAVKSDFAKLPGQLGALTQGGANRQFLRMQKAPSLLGKQTTGTGTSLMVNQPKTKLTDIMKNKALVTGAAGVAGASALMAPRRPHSDNNIQKYASFTGEDLLEKVAEILSDENKQVAKTFATQTLAGIPAHIIGGAVGGTLGDKHLQGLSDTISSKTNSLTKGLRSRLGSSGSFGSKLSKGLEMGKGSGRALGVGLGMAAVGGLADLASLKHSLKGKINKNE